uniref:Uncharacterized protein n=1 Tax=Arundo donax TaxID=35708 RepID=A0A0A8ZJC3_ARUDO
MIMQKVQQQLQTNKCQRTICNLTKRK